MAKNKVDRADQDNSVEGGEGKVKRVRKSEDERFEFFTKRVARLSLKQKSVLLNQLKNDVEKNLDDELARLDKEREALLAVKNA